jgi:hypothetical protein
MAANKAFRLGPLALTATYTTNIFNPGTTTGGVGMGTVNGNIYAILRHMRIINKTAGAVTFRLFLGATGANAAGTELAFDVSIAANSYWEWFGLKRLDVGDFLVGGASALTSLVMEAEGEIGIA